MKYFLGYETTDGRIVKIDNKKVIGASTDLLDIVDFTMKFDSLSELKKELHLQGLLPNEYCPVYYCSQRKMNDPTSIKTINNSQIKLSCDKDYFNPQALKLYIADHANSINFFESMIFHYLKVLGIDNRIQEYLEDLFFNLENPFRLREELLFILNNVITNERLQQVIKEIIASIEKNGVFYLSDFTEGVDAIIENICFNENELTAYYSHLRNSFYKKSFEKENPILAELYKLRSTYYYNLSVKDYYAELSLGENIDNLFRIITCKYGYLKDSFGKYIVQNGRRKKGFIMVDDKYVLKSRALYDLGNFVKYYDLTNRKTLEEPQMEAEEKDLIEEHREEREEFLTEEDYLKYGGV